MHINRVYTKENESVFALFEWEQRDILIEGKDGPVCEMKNIEVPKGWSQQATDILAHKYLRKQGIRGTYTNVNEPDVPQWLQRAERHGIPYQTTRASTLIENDYETSLRQVAHRLAGAWTYTAWKESYFGEITKPEVFHNIPRSSLELPWTVEQERNAKAFYDELLYIICAQIAAPNSPQWFNTGLWWAYGISKGTNQHYRWDKNKNEAVKVSDEDTYKYPQTSACFILGVEDTLVGEDGILDTLKKEATIFKYGSGSGINYSTLRGKAEPLSGGGKSSGMMSFLHTFDSNAGAIKSGGTTRRAARMAIVNHDHPEVEEFVNWKLREEQKVATLAQGAQTTLSKAAIWGDVEQKDGSIKRQVVDYNVPDDDVKRLKALTTEYESEAYATVSGQNSNNSVRVTDEFMRDVASRDSGNLSDSTSGRNNRAVWDQITYAAHQVGDPGLQFDTTVNKWWTIPKAGRVNGSNPCSEAMMNDNSACNLASINLIKFRNGDLTFNYEEFQHVSRLLTIVLDVTIEMSSFPDKKVAENSWKYRYLGLGYANLGGLLMSLGIPYASKEGRQLATRITSTMHFTAWRTSQDLAKQLAPLFNYEEHKDNISNVLNLHTQQQPIDQMKLDDLAEISISNNVYDPVRNAQLTLLAPTGTIGLVMDCATTGIEPDFSLIKYKKLAGGGTMKIVNPLIRKGLEALGYKEEGLEEPLKIIKDTGNTQGALIPSDQEVFACANDIHWKDHIAMMAAVQPFLSGAISKTVNMSNEATIEDVSDAYKLAWESGLKSIAIYRDGCKLAQPLTHTETKTNQETKEMSDTATQNIESEQSMPPLMSIDAKTNEVKLVEPTRTKLPNRREGFTQKVRINGHTIYLRTGEYENGSLGEVFITVSQAGTDINSLMNDFAIALSIALQHGIPLEVFSKAYMGSKSDKGGFVTGSDNVRMCSSIMDYVFKELSAEYNNKSSKENTEPKTETETKPKFTPRIMSAKKQIQAPQVRYSGNSCPSCGSLTLRKNGSCHVCDSCGETTGCS